MNDRAGFSLIELMVVIAILSVVAAIAIPGLFGWLPKYRLGNGARTVLSAIQLARSFAIKECSNSVIAFNNDGSTCQVFIDNGEGSGIPGNNIREGNERLLKHVAFPPGVRLAAAEFRAGDKISFDSRGVLSSGNASEKNIVLTSGSRHFRTVNINVLGSSKIKSN